MAGRYNSLTLQVSRFFKRSSGKRIHKQTINFFLTSITEKTGFKYNNLMLFNQCIESMSINVLKHNPFNPFAPGDFAEKRVLRLVEWFSGHCRAIKG